MDYIDVVSRFNYNKSALQDGPIPLIVEQSDGVLVSLVNICRKTPRKVELKLLPERIRNFKQDYLDGKECSLWIDSGGFNILEKYEICEELLEKYLTNYIDYISTNQDYDKVFSLDFPLAKTEKKKVREKVKELATKTKSKKKKYFDNSWFNTEAIVRKWNYESQKRSIKAINQNPEIREKFVYVYQFRTPTLYKMWTDLYRELDLKNHIRHRAVGGLVGLHRASSEDNGKKLLFSPVIGPAYKCLYDYLDAGDFSGDFTLHFLGISNEIDQFVIIFLERLFTRYLSDFGHKCEAIFSVDTRFHSTKMDKRIRKEGIFFYDKQKYFNVIHRDYDLRLVHLKRLRGAYTDSLKGVIANEINERLSDKKRVKSTADYYPISIYSNNNLNKYFDYFISENSLVEMLIEANDRERLKDDVGRLFEDLLPDPKTVSAIDIVSNLPVGANTKAKMRRVIQDHQLDVTSQPDVDIFYSLYTIFKSPKIHRKKDNLDNKIIESLGRLYEFHKWFVDENREPEKLGFLMSEFIRDIGLKDELLCSR